MIFDILKSLALIILVLFVFFFILGNISLMNHKTDVNIKTPYDVKDFDKTPDALSSVEYMERYNKKLAEINDKECKSAKDQIIKMSLHKTNTTDMALQGISKQLSPLEDTQQPAPELENFEDYAPVDVPSGAERNNKGTLQFKDKADIEPLPANEQGSQHISKFASQMSVPWNEKKGKDELSTFFNTHAFDKSFDNGAKLPVACPTSWENDTKR
jgi:hypothetical protein